MSQQLWGVELPIGGVVTLPSSTGSLHVTNAVLVAEKGTVFNAFAGAEYLVEVHSGDKKVIVASLAPSRPNAVLGVVTELKSKIGFSLISVNEANSSGYKVQLSGYTTGGANVGGVTASQSQKRKPEAEQPKAQAAAKKQKVAEPEPEEDADEDEDGEDEDDELEFDEDMDDEDMDDEDMDDEDLDDEEDEEEEEAPAPPPKKATKEQPKPKEQPKTKEQPKPAATTPTKPTKPQIVTLKGGLKLQDTKVGTGKEAVDRSAVGIRYRGSLASNGKVFDSNMPRGQPLRFKIGGGDVISGFELGTKGMRVGGTRTVVIPPHMGYGARGAPPDIPGNATLVFDLELISVK